MPLNIHYRQLPKRNRSSPRAIVLPPPSSQPLPIKMPDRSNAALSFLPNHYPFSHRPVLPSASPQNHFSPSTAGGRELGLESSPPCLFYLAAAPQTNLLNQPSVKPKHKCHRVTPLLAQRIPLPGNSCFWRTGPIMAHVGRGRITPDKSQKLGFWGTPGRAALRADQAAVTLGNTDGRNRRPDHLRPAHPGRGSSPT